MKVLLVNGSPHKSGCTHTALVAMIEEFRAAGIEADEFWIGNKPIAGCMACSQCGKLGKCVIEGDKVEEFLAIAGDYDGYVFGSPVYYAGIAGSLKCFMDRTFFSNQGRVKFALKPAAVVASARRAGTTSTLEDIEKFVQHQQMIQVNSWYWPMVHGNAAEQVLQDEEGVQGVRMLARNMAWLLKNLEAGRAAGIAEPEPFSPRAWTNFVR